MSGGRNTSQDPDYVGPVGHEKKVHKTHFGVLKTSGGNQRVKVETADGFTYMSRQVAVELGLKIISPKVEE